MQKIGSNMNDKGHSDEMSGGNKKLKKKSDTCKLAESLGELKCLGELCFSPSVLWKVERMNNRYLDNWLRKFLSIYRKSCLVSPECL